MTTPRSAIAISASGVSARQARVHEELATTPHVQLIADHCRAIITPEQAPLIDVTRRRDAVEADVFPSGHIRRSRITLATRPELFE